MKQTLKLFLLVMIISLTGCNDDSSDTQVDSQLDENEWHLSSYVDSNNNTTELLASAKYSLVFDLTTKQVSGSFDCNQLSASFTLDGDALSLTDILQTEIYCGVFDVEYDERNNFIISVLNRLESHEIVGDQLTLTSIRGEKLIYKSN